MYKIEREFSIAIGHALSKHKGKCKSLHGHNINVFVGLKSDKLNENNMIMDFSDLKKICNEIIEPLDHSMLLNKSEVEMIELLSNQKRRFCVFDDDPTAEFLCKYLCDNITTRLMILGYPNDIVDYIKVYENEKSNATYVNEIIKPEQLDQKGKRSLEYFHNKFLSNLIEILHKYDYTDYNIQDIVDSMVKKYHEMEGKYERYSPIDKKGPRYFKTRTEFFK